MAALILPAGILVTVLLVVPMLFMARYSLNEYDPIHLMQEALTFHNYVQAVTDSYYRNILLITLLIAFVCTLVTACLAYAPAYWLACMDSRWKSKVTILTMFPLLVGGVVRSAGYIAVLGNEGGLNYLLMRLGLVSEPLQMMYTPFAVIVGIVGVVLPYMILTLSAVIESIPRDVEEAAANLGAGESTVFFRVLLPLSVPGLVAGGSLVFILCMNAYATPVLLGGPQFHMMAPTVYDQFARVNNWPFGAALAFYLLLTTVIMTIVGSGLIGRRYKVSMT